MTHIDVTALLSDWRTLAPAVGIAALLAFLAAWKVRGIIRSPRPDDALSNIAMLAGFGWSSEAVWVLAGPKGADLPTPIRIALFAIFEVILVVFMIRTKRNMSELGRPGNAGRMTWFVATGMSLVAVWTAHNPGEAFLRLLVPILLTAMWWNGIVGESAVTRDEDATSWNWTLRNALLWLGAIKPGKKDVDQINRDHLTQTMTRLEFRRRHGSERRKERAVRKLARLSLAADDEIVAQVRDRVDRAMWFETAQADEPQPASPRSIPASRAASARACRVRQGRTIRALRMTYARPIIIPVQASRQDPRTTQDIDFVARVIKDARPELSGTRIAELVASSEPTIRRSLRRTGRTKVTQPETVNGRVPDLSEVSS